MRNESRALAGVLMLLGCASWAHAGGASLPRSTPEAEGISSQAIVDFVEAADKNVDTFDSFMIVRHGKVIAAGWWKPNSSGAGSRSDTRSARALRPPLLGLRSRAIS